MRNFKPGKGQLTVDLESAWDIARRQAPEVPLVPVGAKVWTIAAHFGYRCYYCGQSVSRERNTRLARHAPNAATIDHVVPRCDGGSDLGNRVCSCHSCNNLKGANTVETFMHVLRHHGIRDSTHPALFGLFQPV